MNVNAKTFSKKRRRMLKLAAISALMLIGGCATEGALTNDDGTKLTTAGGAPIMVVEHPTYRAEPAVAENAPYEARLAAKKKGEKAEVQISIAAAETARKVKTAAVSRVNSMLRSLKNKSIDEFKSVVVFVGDRPQVTDETLSRIIRENHQQSSRDAIVALRALIESEVQNCLIKEIYPTLVQNTVNQIRPAVERAVKDGKFKKAREIIWTASATDIPQVNAAVRVEAMKLMHDLVNPSAWESLEKQIDATFKRHLDAHTFDAGIKELKELEAKSLVREYSKFIDKKIDAIKAELASIGVPEADMDPIIAKQHDIIAAAANITDILDRYVTVKEATSEVNEVEARKDPALKAYYEKLDDFHATLIRYNCTEANAERITVALDKDFLALVELLKHPAKSETSVTEAEQKLELGTRSLNTRIHETIADRIGKLTAARDAKIRAEYLARLAAAKSDLEKQVRALVANGKFEEARELIWNASISGDVEWDAEMFAIGLELLRNLVNPQDWARIEKEILAKFDELSAAGDFAALREYLETYPLIRQHTVKLDNQLAKVKAEAEALGADPTAAAAAARVACGMVTEAEQLVDHLDQLVAESAKAGGEIDKSGLQKALDAYAKKLAAYHATEANVTTIVEKLRVELEKLIAAPTNPETTRLVLGTNAVNDRIRALVEKLLASIADTKHNWENERLVTVTTDLEKRVREAVKEGRFDDARGYIRDEKLIGRDDVDLKLYELRVGLLDSCVNPAQLDYLLAQIDTKVEELTKAEDFAALVEFLNNPPQVHDEYEAIDSALAAVKNAMLALEISEKESEYDEKVRFFKSIQELLEKRRESWKPARDLSAVEKALTDVALAMFAHLNKHPELIEAEKKSEYLHILADIAALDRTITTWELNELLRARAQQHRPAAEQGRAIQLYRELLAKIDGEVNFDTQVLLAEEAISRQLGIVCDKASFKINAVLGEYARAFRLLKGGAKLSGAEATSILLGGAYLDQAAVVSYALELGADVNGVSARDPRKRTALMLAIDTQHLTLIKAILEAGASTTAADVAGNTVMHYAVKSGSVAVVRAIAETADVKAVNAAGETPLFEAVRRNQAALVDAVTALVAEAERAAFVNAADAQGLTAFALAAKTGARDVLDPLAAAGAEFSEKDLILAERGDHVGVAQWLVGKGADVNAEGVMDAACPATATGRYLVAEGGVGSHTCEVCKPAPVAPIAPEAEAKSAKLAEAEGTISFKVSEAK